MSVLPFLQIAVAYGLYILVAIGTSKLMARYAGTEAKAFAERNARKVLWLGGAANFLILVLILGLWYFWNQQTLGAFGLSFDALDLQAALGLCFLTYGLGFAFVWLLKFTHQLDRVDWRRASFQKELPDLGVALLVLGVVVGQEELLNRGYVMVSLWHLSPYLVVAFATLLFTLIHLLTNPANLWQILSWGSGGAMLGFSYLLSGSLWVPIILHYAIDTANVLIFNITGRGGLLQTNPALTTKQRALYRVVFALIILLYLYGVYQGTFRLSNLGTN